MSPTAVLDDERLFRAVNEGRCDYTILAGKLRFSAAAFNDKERKPSVDRSSLRHDPADLKFSPTDAVTQVLAVEVRGISDVRITPNKKNDDHCYGVDALHRPIIGSVGIKENLAHCQIECTPEIQSTHFKKVKEALARIADRHGLILK